MLAHLRQPNSPACLGRDGLRSWSNLLADAARICPTLAGHDAICNLVANRYDFIALLVAAMSQGVPTVLPTSRARKAIAAALNGCRNALVAERVDTSGPAAGTLAGDPGGEVRVYTSGSTGAPVRHRKTWRILSGGARLASDLAASAGALPGQSLIIGTTPHQHMYGLEAVVFTCLAHGYCIWDQTPFYPADLEAAVDSALSAGFRRIVLVSSPPHLRFLAETVRRLAPICCIISATAPLHPDIARRFEGEHRPALEIYGSSETGSLAWRRTTETDLWTLLDGFSLTQGEDGWNASSPHLPDAVPLPDDIECQADGRFRLLGRRGDMVRIAGKRQSLGALNAALSALTGIGDAVMVSEKVDGEDHLSVFVVPAPGGDTDPGSLARMIRGHLRLHVDPVFVPRRVHVVGVLPRNATGKVGALDIAALRDGAYGIRPD